MLIPDPRHTPRLGTRRIVALIVVYGLFGLALFS